MPDDMGTLSPAPLMNLHGMLDDGEPLTTRSPYLGQSREVFDRPFPSVDSDPARDWPVPLHHPERERSPQIAEQEPIADGPPPPATRRDEPARTGGDVDPSTARADDADG